MKERKKKFVKDKHKDKPNKTLFNISVPYLPHLYAYFSRAVFDTVPIGKSD